MNDVQQIGPIEAGPAAEAAVRSHLYRSLAAWTRFPSEGFHHEALEGTLADDARMMIDALPYRIEFARAYLSALNEVDSDYVRFQASYVGTFDVGAGGPPCPLYAGAWLGDRQNSMEEALRFYRFFGLRISSEDELPDHLPTELEFLHYLTFKEALAEREGGDVTSLRLATRDFLCRHVNRWLNPAAERIRTIEAAEFWRGLVGLTQTICEADAQYLAGLEGPPAE